LGEDMRQDIVDSLDEISKEFIEEGFNLEFLVEETEKFFSERSLIIFHQTVEVLTRSNKRDEAEKLIRDYKPISRTGKLSNHICTANVLEQHNVPSPITIMSPWLKQGQITIIYANYGVGKSLLSILIGYISGLRNFDKEECEINEWFVKEPTGCLYVDGELGEKEMVDRIKQYRWLGEQPKSRHMQVFSIPDYQIRTEDMFHLGQRKNQLELVTWLKEHQDYKLIILDSVSTLFGLENENDNSEWGNKVNPFLRDLRALNVACIMLHHSGKNAKTGLRGASAMGAMAENIFKLKTHPSIDEDAGEAWFTIIKEKQRSGGKQFKNFSMHFSQNEEKTETSWEITRNTEC
jgi:hypothetical protein